MHINQTTSLVTPTVPEIFALPVATGVARVQATPEVRSPPWQFQPFVAVGRLMTCVDAPAVPVHLNVPTAAPPTSVPEVAHAPVPVPSVNFVPPSTI